MKKTHQDYFKAVEFAKETTDKVIEKLEQIAIENKIEAKITTEYIAEQNAFVIEVNNMTHYHINEVAKVMLGKRAQWTSTKSGYIIIDISE